MDHDNKGQTQGEKNALGHFDEFGEFKYNHFEKEVNKGERAHIDLKNLSEQNFLDLISAKNQDKRFYSWLHFHPLFDDEEWNSDNGFGCNKRPPRKNSEQINNLNQGSLIACEPNNTHMQEEDSEDDLQQ